MKSDASMATRSPQMSGRKPGDVTTEFQLHKSQLQVDVKRRTLFDYSAFRLQRYIENLKDDNQRKTLTDILKKYKQGLVAIAWRRGQPVWINVTKETTKI